jgi:hypothetical protein
MPDAPASFGVPLMTIPSLMPVYGRCEVAPMRYYAMINTSAFAA